MSGAEKDLDGLPGVHRLVAGRCLVEWELEVEDLAGVDPPVPDQVDEFGRNRRTGAGPPCRLMPEKNKSATGSSTSWKTPTRWPPGRVERMAWVNDSWVPTASTTVCAEPSGQLLDPCHSVVAALFDDVGGAELAGQRCRGACRLIAIICSAPSCLAASTASSPTAPSPTTATAFPGPAWAATAANHPVPSTSEAASNDGISSASGWSGVATRCHQPTQSAQIQTGHRSWRRAGAERMGLVASLADLAGVVGGEEGSDDNWPGLIVLRIADSSTIPTYS